MAFVRESIFRHSAVDEHAQLVQGALPTAELGTGGRKPMKWALSPIPWSAMAGSSPFPWFCTEPGCMNRFWYCTASWVPHRDLNPVLRAL